MKKQLLFTIMLAFISLSSNFAQISTNGLVACYKFSGNVIDSSGNGYNGTNNGATLTTDRFNNSNKAFYFNGSGNNITSNPVLPVGNAARSVSAWFKTTSSSGYNGWSHNTVISWGSPSGWQLFSVSIYEGVLIIGFFANVNDMNTGRVVNDGNW